MFPSSVANWSRRIETTASEVGSSGCGTLARLHDRRLVRVRDLPAGGRPVMLVWRKRGWRCVESAFAVSTWSERHEQIRARAVLTERAGWMHTDGSAAMGTQSAVNGTPLVDDPARLAGGQTIGVDETAFRAANARRSTTFATG